MQQINPLFMNLALILVIASIITLIFKYLRQPVVLGYVVAGLLTTLLPFELDKETITLWGEIGVAFLLFALGLEFSFKKLKNVGGAGSITALTELLIMMTVGVLAGKMIGMNFTSSLFLGGMISISSTSIIIKTFDALNVKNRSFAQVVFGVLIIEDLVAIMLLVLLSSVAVSRHFSSGDLIAQVVKLLIFLIILFTSGIFIIPSFLRSVKKYINDETLLIVSVGLCFGAVVASVYSGFSPALGAFMMGAILAETDQQEKIHTLIQPLRDLFAAVFFISVGMLVEPSVIMDHPFQVLIVTALVLFIKPIAATIGVLFTGRTVKQSMQSGMCLGQIGEFSFIIASLGLSLGVLDDSLYPMIVVVSIITTFITPIYVKNADKVYDKLFTMLPSPWRTVLQHYGTGRLTLNRENEWHKLLRAYVIRILVSSGWMIIVMLVSFNIIYPLFKEYVGDQWWVTLIMCLLTLASLSPFIYALIVKRTSSVAFRKLWNDRKYARAPLLMLVFIRYVIAGGFIGVAIGSYYVMQLAFLLPTIVIIGGIVVMSRNLRKHYQSIEHHFLKNLDKTSLHSGIAIPSELTNNIHMEYFDIPVDSELVGK
ncbi:MAG: cation:proton antiporter, partial [Rikenellaceae bacterium]